MPFFPRYRLVAAVAYALLTLALCGCSQTMRSVEQWGAENAALEVYRESVDILGIREQGYYEKQLAPDRYEVISQGHPMSDYARLERIAMARAAELTLVNRFTHFRVLRVARGGNCRRMVVNGSKGTPHPNQVILTIEVQLARNPAGGGHLDAARELVQIKGALETTRPTPADRLAARNALAAQCMRAAG